MSENNPTVPATNVEPNTSNGSLEAEKAKGLDTRINITVTSYRYAKHDPDGISAKAVLDGIVRAGLLPDDSTKEIKSVKFESVIIKKTEDEKTIIEW